MLPEAAPQSCDLSSIDGTAALAVKAAKELQNTALEDFKVGMNAVLDHARDVVDTRKPSADHVARLDGPVVAGVGAAERYRAESLELARASLETAIDHARGLIRARTLAECVELSGKLARKQCAFAVRQAGAFKSFARAAVQSDPS
jgi:Phasin protein